MGFAYSDQTKTTFTSLFPDQFNSAVGHGVNGSKNYAVAYAYRQPAELRTTHAGPTVIPGTYVTNTAWVKQVTQTGTKMGSEPDAPSIRGTICSSSPAIARVQRALRSPSSTTAAPTRRSTTR